MDCPADDVGTEVGSTRAEGFFGAFNLVTNNKSGNTSA